jgi:hypothetical protein
MLLNLIRDIVFGFPPSRRQASDKSTIFSNYGGWIQSFPASLIPGWL